MDEDEDDIYGSGPGTNGRDEHEHTNGNGMGGTIKHEDGDVDIDDADDDEDDSESDIDIITERKDAPAAPIQDFKQAKREPVRMSAAVEPQREQRAASQSAPTKQETPAVQGGKLTVRDGSKYPDYRSSNIDINNIPLYDPAGKPITEIDLDADVAMEIKPWRVPGTDPTDFFNYGFDEFTWVQYCMKQNAMKETVTGLKNETKQFEAMLGGGQPAGGGMPTMPGMGEMPPDMMNAIFGQMQAQGLSDPSQLDFGAIMQQMGMPGMQGGFNQGGGQGQFGNQQHGQSPYAGNQGYGGGTPQPGQQGMSGQQNFDGFSAQQVAMMQQQQGGGGGRGRGRGRRW